MDGRVYFEDNPWPEGLVIEVFELGGRFAPTSGIWLDLHVRTVALKRMTNDEVLAEIDAVGDEWRGRAAWCEYQTVTLSSTYWAEERPDEEMGVLIGSRESPLDSTGPIEVTADTHLKEADPDGAAFGAYVLGHDSLGHHRIKLGPLLDQTGVKIDWSGRLARTYIGDYTFDYGFRVTASNVLFRGIALPAGTKSKDALLCLKQPEAFSLREIDDRRWLVPGGAQPEPRKRVIGGLLRRMRGGK